MEILYSPVQSMQPHVTKRKEGRGGGGGGGEGGGGGGGKIQRNAAAASIPGLYSMYQAHSPVT